MTSASIPRQYSLVKIRPELAESMLSVQPKYWNDMPLIFLGEIPNMPEHGVYIGHHSGRIYSGYHIFDFIELNEDEI